MRCLPAETGFVEEISSGSLRIGTDHKGRASITNPFHKPDWEILQRYEAQLRFEMAARPVRSNKNNTPCAPVSYRTRISRVNRISDDELPIKISMLSFSVNSLVQWASPENQPTMIGRFCTVMYKARLVGSRLALAMTHGASSKKVSSRMRRAGARYRPGLRSVCRNRSSPSWANTKEAWSGFHRARSILDGWRRLYPRSGIEQACLRGGA